MKNSKNKSSIKILLLIALCFAGASHSYSQIQQQTNYFDYIAGPLYSNDIGEAITTDPATGNYYVASEVASNSDFQGVHVRKFNSNGTEVNSKIYNDTNYREYVKKIIYAGSYLYVICNAVHKTTGISTLMVVKFTPGLSNSITASNYSGFTFHDPTDACAAGSSNIYISCYKSTGTYEELAAVKINSSLTIVNSYSFHHNSITDNIQENPKQIVFNQNDQSVYVAGGSYKPSDGKSATLAIRLGSNLVPVWAIKGSFTSGKNVYNSVAVNDTGVFFAGCRKSSGISNWIVRKLNTATGATEVTRSQTFAAGYTSEALKITFCSLNKIMVIGYAENTAQNKYELKIGNYVGDISGVPAFYGTPLTPGSVINDGVSVSNGYTYVTGQKYIGGLNSEKDMFLYMFNNSGSITYRDSIVNQNAAGNKLAYNNGAYAFLAVTGFKNNSSTPWQPTDFKITTRFYNVQIPRMANETVDNDIKIYPNPCNDVINIENKETINSYELYDVIGKTLIEKNVSDDMFKMQINMTTLPEGIYFLRVNNTSARKIIKN